jgi:hypothetical protein
MAWTEWKTAGTVGYWTDTGIEFTDGDSVLDRANNLITVAPIVGVSSGRSVSSYGSRGLVFSNFGVSVNSAISVAVEITAQRLARIVDTQVQLVQGTVLLGKNLADVSTENFKVYSGSCDSYWGVKALTVSSNQFGVLLDFGASPVTPSRNSLILRSVRVRVEY